MNDPKPSECAACGTTDQPLHTVAYSESGLREGTWWELEYEFLLCSPCHLADYIVLIALRHGQLSKAAIRCKEDRDAQVGNLGGYYP